MIPLSFGKSGLNWPPSGFTLQHYQNLAASPLVDVGRAALARHRLRRRDPGDADRHARRLPAGAPADPRQVAPDRLRALADHRAADDHRGRPVLPVRPRRPGRHVVRPGDRPHRHRRAVRRDDDDGRAAQLRHPARPRGAKPRRDAVADAAPRHLPDPRRRPAVVVPVRVRDLVRRADDLALRLRRPDLDPAQAVLGRGDAADLAGDRRRLDLPVRLPRRC